MGGRKLLSLLLLVLLLLLYYYIIIVIAINTIVNYYNYKGCNTELTKDDGYTALHIAAEKDDLESAALLVDAGAYLDHPHRIGFVVVFYVLYLYFMLYCIIYSITYYILYIIYRISYIIYYILYILLYNYMNY